MTTHIITYDLKKEPTKHDYKGFYEYIKKLPWARLSESSYAIKTNDSPDTIFKALKAHIDSNDWVLVLTLTNPHCGQHSKQVIDWLATNL